MPFVGVRFTCHRDCQGGSWIALPAWRQRAARRVRVERSRRWNRRWNADCGRRAGSTVVGDAAVASLPAGMEELNVSGCKSITVNDASRARLLALKKVVCTTGYI